jgi:hypothetical protein
MAEWPAVFDAVLTTQACAGILCCSGWGSVAGGWKVSLLIGFLCPLPPLMTLFRLP